MRDYKKGYFALFNRITEIVEILLLFQIEAERAFIADEHNDEDEDEEELSIGDEVSP